jgi:hypothetical protein
MGGDIAIAAAGIDHRIRKVAACIATPDWLRPGSFEPPGEADTYAWHCYNRCNPLSNLHLYKHLPSISFICGEQDTRVPPEAADRFVSILGLGSYKNDTERLDVVKLKDIDHAFVPEMLERAIQSFVSS